MLKIGITGQSGFVGSHLFNTLGLLTEEFVTVPFDKNYFSDEKLLQNFAEECDVIVHLAAVNRHNNADSMYKTNIELTEKLIKALELSKSKAHVVYSSSVHEEKENLYGVSKREAREMLYNGSLVHGYGFTGLIIPNVFGPFGRPHYNSVIATFCHQLTHNEFPTVVNDVELKLIYIDELILNIISTIRLGQREFRKIVPHTFTAKVSEILSKLMIYKLDYFDKGEIPILKNKFELSLFNTFRSYIDYSDYFPRALKKHSDERGVFVEIVRLGVGGQCSFSTTNPGITRGNHFHTRKIERFAVIKGRARVQLRKIHTTEMIEFYLDGNKPAFIDMPIWHTHNITNIGNDELFTIFWINEVFHPEDTDTFFMIV